MVLVTGAGPVGLTMAMSLTRLGVDVRIIDKNAERTDKSKALVIWPRTLELLDIQGCAEAFVAAGLKGAGARMLAGGRELVHVRFDTARSAYRFALLIPQSETERVLEEELARLGVRVERQVDLHSFAQDDDGVSVVLDGPSGRTENARVDWLMGCDGAHSTIRMGLGAQFEGSTHAFGVDAGRRRDRRVAAAGRADDLLDRARRARAVPDHRRPRPRDCGHGREHGRRRAAAHAGGTAGGDRRNAAPPDWPRATPSGSPASGSTSAR